MVQKRLGRCQADRPVGSEPSRPSTWCRGAARPPHPGSLPRGWCFGRGAAPHPGPLPRVFLARAALGQGPTTLERLAGLSNRLGNRLGESQIGPSHRLGLHVSALTKGQPPIDGGETGRPAQSTVQSTAPAPCSLPQSVVVHKGCRQVWGLGRIWQPLACPPPWLMPQAEEGDKS